MGWILSAFRHFGRAIFAVAALVGILFLPKDIKDYRDALSEWGPLVSLVERDTALILFSAVLVLWIVWRDVRPFALPPIKAMLGWRLKADLITALDNKLADGVVHRNRIRSDDPVELFEERARFRDWNVAVLDELVSLSLRERSYFRTLDLFDGQFRLRTPPDPERSQLEMIWSEKLRRLREIIGRIEE